MANDYLGPRRLTPLHAGVTQPVQEQNTAQTKPLQEHAGADAAVHDPTQEVAPLPLDDYTISVDQVRTYFSDKGLTKSKDTVQRWCRQGDLDCRKRGVLGRYFTTETSLKTLERKLLPDMIAEESSTKVDAAARRGENAGKPVHAAEGAAEDTRMQVQVQPDAGADSGAKQNAPISHSSNPTIAELKAQVAGLTSQLEQTQAMNNFLQEEVVSARGQRGDVVRIAEQMLGTLESIAVGGRLERPRPSSPDAIRYQPGEAETDRL